MLTALVRLLSGLNRSVCLGLLFLSEAHSRLQPNIQQDKKITESNFTNYV